ncbi:Putative protein of unknown function [Podospora comata]|uniref:Cytochrome b5 heme-binding domain-containing protein n=1 Tax=Podospora comata TaxID=48703 RepID=A0ABY6SC76_PODCO|nr:Putative protein of unknown function [Podospora comata]
MAQITSAHLQTHNTAKDLWVAVHGYVYDLTSFAADHPGGIDVLLECAGTDASEPYDYAGHGDDATTTMQKFRVGELAGCRHAKSKTNTGGGRPVAESAGGKGSSSWIVKAASVLNSRVILSCLIGGAALLGLILLQRAPVEGVDGRSFSGVGSLYSFLGGLFVATVVCLVGAGYVYNEFNRTLKPEKDVFDYPALIPRRRDKKLETLST